MSRIILFNKPYGVLCQFRPVEGRQTLKDYIAEPAVYPAGRLDADSEGLLALTGDGALQNRISAPQHKLEKTYYVQVEGIATTTAIEQLRRGVALRDYVSKPARVEQVEPPDWLWPRQPPVRFRKNVPTSWIRVSISEGRNRQVRHMTAAVGFPTLRLIRYAIGDWTIANMEPGKSRSIEFDLHTEPVRRTRVKSGSAQAAIRPARKRTRS